MNEYGRVWDETDVTELLDEIQSDEGIAGYDRQVVLDLIATIRDREKTIAEKDAEIERLRETVKTYERVVEAARHWRDSRRGGNWGLQGGSKELLGLFTTRLAREEALIRAVDALGE